MTRIETYEGKIIDVEGEFKEIFKDIVSAKLVIEYPNDKE
jgi:hypothetical protein